MQRKQKHRNKHEQEEQEEQEEVCVKAGTNVHVRVFALAVVIAQSCLKTMQAAPVNSIKCVTLTHPTIKHCEFYIIPSVTVKVKVKVKVHVRCASMLGSAWVVTCTVARWVLCALFCGFPGWVLL